MYVIAAVTVLSIDRRTSPTSMLLSFIYGFLRWNILAVTKSPVPITSCFDAGEGVTVIIVYVILALAEIRECDLAYFLR